MMGSVRVSMVRRSMCMYLLFDEFVKCTCVLVDRYLGDRVSLSGVLVLWLIGVW